MFEQSNSGEPRNAMGDWAIRGFIAFAAIAVGWDKFSLRGEWVEIFRRIGWGQWFRYFTGVVEILGGLLVLVPRAAVFGLVLLAATMIGASVVNLFIHPSTFLLPLILAVVLGGYAWIRWRG